MRAIETRARVTFALAALALVVSGSATAQEASETAAIIRLDGKIDGLVERTMEMRVKRALEQGARFIIISIESGGGEVVAGRTIAWSLKDLQKQREDLTIVAFARGHALSIATMVAFGCEMIAMAPSGQIGDSMPIGVREGWDGRPEEISLAEKFIAPLRKDFEALALESGYPVDAAAAMVDPRIELHRVEVKDEQTGRIQRQWLTEQTIEEKSHGFRASLLANDVVCSRGELLVLSAHDAMEMGICRMVVSDEKALVALLAEEYSIDDLQIVEIEEFWWSSVVRFVTWTPVKILLFVIGLVALVVSLAQPGTGAAEGTFVLCWGAVFFGSYLIGLADWVEITLLVIGVGLLATEVFVTPGFGFVGGGGALCIAAALLLSFQRFVIPQTDLQWDILVQNLAKTLTGCGLSVVGVALAIRFLPETTLLKGLKHMDTQPATPMVTLAQEQAPVGTIAVSATSLRPVGKVKLKGEVYEAVAESGLVEQGVTVVVVAHRGNELVVSSRPEAMTIAEEPEPAPTEPEPEGTDAANTEETP